eukprot:SAG31_NODE_200_length_20519_cov_57.688833_9_plen_70_part_00
MMVSIGKAACEGAPDPADRPPYIGDGYETITDLIASDIDKAVFAPFGFKQQARRALVEHIQSLQPESVH